MSSDAGAGRAYFDRWITLLFVAAILPPFIQRHGVIAPIIQHSPVVRDDYIRNNCEFIPNFGERRRQGETNPHGVRRIDNQSGGQQTLRQEATDAMDVEGCSSSATNPDEGPQRRVGQHI